MNSCQTPNYPLAAVLCRVPNLSLSSLNCYFVTPTTKGKIQQQNNLVDGSISALSVTLFFMFLSLHKKKNEVYTS